MKNIQTMKRKKMDTVDEMRALLDGAESRGMTHDENVKYRELEAEVRVMEKEILNEEESQEREMRTAVAIDGPPGEVRSFDRDNLHELRSLYGSPQHGMTFDSWLRGIITGRGESRQDPATVGAIGMYSVPGELFGQLIYDSFGQTCVVEAGARLFPMHGMTMYVPRLTGLPDTMWLGELERHEPRNEFVWEGVTLTAQKLSTQVATSVELYDDSQLVREEVGGILSKALALELDRAAILGAPNGPTGLVNTAGVLNLNVDGPIEDYRPLSYAHGHIREQCGYEPTAVILSPNTWAQIDSLVDTTGQPMQPPPSYQTYRKLSACYLHTQDYEYEVDHHVGVMGDFRRFAWAIRHPAQIEISRCEGDNWTDYAVSIRAFLRAAPCVITPQAFCVLDNITGLDLSTLPANG